MRTTSLPFISALKEHPTPQYAHVVSTERVGAPIVNKFFSFSAPVGQTWTQAPQDTHSDSIKFLFPALTRASNARPVMVSAKVPCTSSQARTHRLQTMHSVESKLKYGLDSSLGISK